MIVTLKDLSRIELFSTDSRKKLRACDVRKKTGADVVINGTLFDWGSWRPVCDVKAAGKVLSNDPYTYWGLAWNQSDDHFTVISTKDIGLWENVISCVMLVRNGAKQAYHANPDVARAAPRTALYQTADGLTHIWCDKKAMTPNQLQSELLRRRAVWGLMLDGGGSTQLSQEGKDYVYSDRRVQNYLCFWCRKQDNEPEGEKPMVEINAYSKEKDGKKKLSAHFAVWEFACKDGSDAVLVAPRLVMVLESIRSHLGITDIHSAYRTPQYNIEVGGSPHSQHCYGTAADISVRGVSHKKVAEYARQLMPDWGGVGIYSWGVHVDVREVKADWRG